MKAVLSVFTIILLISNALADQTMTSANASSVLVPAPTEYQIVNRGANNNVWQRETYEAGPNGQIITHEHQYTELASGLNYQDANGNWTPAQEIINILSDGTAAATNGQHQAYFPADIDNGMIEVVTPDGKLLQSRPIGLSYDDGTNMVLIAVLTNSIGEVVNPNQIVYSSSFSDLDADLQYTYTKGGFEQDVVLRAQLPKPEQFGLNSASTTLQVLTEFVSPPAPTILTNPVPLGNDNSLADESLDFGAMQMGTGKAFTIGRNSGEEVRVTKQWTTIEGRTILVESVPWPAIADQLNQLPVNQQATARRPQDSRTVVAVPKSCGNLVETLAKQLLPELKAVKPNRNKIKLAKHQTAAPAFVMDYVTMVSQTNYTFQTGITYYISGPVQLWGTNTFEGGAVIKYTNGVPLLFLSPAINWLAPMDQPAIFTAWNDDTVGDIISGSTGNPTNYYASTALVLNNFSSAISNLVVAYAQQALAFNGGTRPALYNAQFLNCKVGINVAGVALNLRNALFANILNNPFTINSGSTIDAQNVTLGNAGSLVVGPSSPSGAALNLTNCVFANVTNLTSGVLTLSGGTNGFFNTSPFGAGAITNAFYPFTTGALASNYLVAGTTFRDAGTTNLDTNLLAELQITTTYAPQDGSYPDTNAPDLGYHYSTNEDSDYDGLPDWWEWKYFGNFTNTGSGDYDGDGDSNGTEYTNNTDPTLAALVSITGYAPPDVARPGPGFVPSSVTYDIQRFIYTGPGQAYASSLVSNLVVHFTLGGTAVDGVDYVLRDQSTGEIISNSITILADSGSANIELDPTTNLLCLSNLTVTITLVENPNDHYLVDEDNSQGASATTISIEPNVFSLIATVPTPCGIDYHPPTHSLLISSKDSGIWSFLRIDTNGIVTNWSGVQISGSDEIKLATVKNTANGFTNGAMYFDSSTSSGTIGWLSSDGSVSNLNFVSVPGDKFYGLYIDQGGSFSGDLIAGQYYGDGSGGAWEITATGVTNHFVAADQIETDPEGILTLTNDVARYGPWAGKTVTGIQCCTDDRILYAADTNGVVTSFNTTNLNMFVEDCDLIPTNQDLYCNDDDDGWVLKVSKELFANNVGDVLITQDGFDRGDPPALFIVHWDLAASNFVRTAISPPDYIRGFEHSSFAPIDIPPVSP